MVAMSGAGLNPGLFDTLLFKGRSARSGGEVKAETPLATNQGSAERAFLPIELGSESHENRLRRIARLEPPRANRLGLMRVRGHGGLHHACKALGLMSSSREMNKSDGWLHERQTSQTIPTAGVVCSGFTNQGSTQQNNSQPTET